MLTKCFNPGCDKTLDYLRYGRVVRSVRTALHWKAEAEHDWLTVAMMLITFMTSSFTLTAACSRSEKSGRIGPAPAP